MQSTGGAPGAAARVALVLVLVASALVVVSAPGASQDGGSGSEGTVGASVGAGTPATAPIFFTQGEGLLPLPDIAATGDSDGQGSDVRTGDLNDDGLVDLVAVRHADTSRNALQVALGSGGGAFGPPNDVYLGADSSGDLRLAVGDADGDDDLDVFVSIVALDEVWVFLNDGSGGFASTADVTIPVGVDITLFDATDLDGDDDADVVTVHRDSDEVRIFENTGSATFAAPMVEVVGGGTDEPQTLVIADTDGDTDLDISVGFVANGASVATLVYDDPTPADANLGDYTLREDVLRFGAGARADNMLQMWVTPDVTGDGVIDLAGFPRVHNCPSTSCFFVAEGDGTGFFDIDDIGGTDGAWQPLSSLRGFADDLVQSAPVDANGDGHLDFLVAARGSTAVNVVFTDPDDGLSHVTLSSGNGSPVDQATNPSNAASNDQRPVESARWSDLDGDGRSDIVLVQGASQESRTPADVVGIFNDEDHPAGFAAAFQVGLGRELWRTSTTADHADLADWTGDEVLDLVTFDAAMNLVVAGGSGDGTFADATVAAADPLSAPANCADSVRVEAIDHLRVLDVDGDDVLDVVLTSHPQADDTSASLCVAYGDGSGGIAATTGFVALGEGRETRAVYRDVDGDDDLDAILRQLDGDDVVFTLFRNDAPTRTFTVSEAARITVTDFRERYAYNHVLADVDGANGPDLVYRRGIDVFDYGLAVHLNDGTGTFDPTPVVTNIDDGFTYGDGDIQAAAGDFDGDGDEDITFSLDDLTSYLLESNGDGTVTAPAVEILLTNRNAPVEVVDMNSDGALDLVSASHGLGIEVALNRGDGDISDGTRFTDPFKFSTSRTGLARPLVGDLNGDGALDVVAQYRGEATTPWGSFTVLLRQAALDPLADLEVGAVRAPAVVTPGLGAAIEIDVANTGAAAIGTGNVITADVELLVDGIGVGTPVRRDLSFAGDFGPGDDQTLVADIPVPAGDPGTYRFRVTIDPIDEIPEEAERTLGDVDPASTGNVGVSDPASVLEVPLLDRDDPPVDVTVDGVTERWFRIVDGGPVQIAATGPAGSTVSIFAADGTLPTVAAFDRSGTSTGPGASLQLLATVETFVLVRVTGADNGDTTIAATVPPAEIAAVSPTAAVIGPLFVTVEGTFLGSATSATLENGASVVNADAIDLDPVTGELSLFFDATGEPPDTWDLRLVTPGGDVVEADAIELFTQPDLLADSGGVLDVSISSPSVMRRGRTSTVVVSYANTGSGPLFAPTIHVEVSAGEMSVWGGERFTEIDFFAPTSHVQPWLLPGEAGSVELSYHSPDEQVSVDFDVWALSVSDPAHGADLFDWDDVAASPAPGIDAARWSVLIEEQRAEWGETNADVALAIGERYTELRLVGLDPLYVNGVWRFPPEPPSGTPPRLRLFNDTSTTSSATPPTAAATGGSCNVSFGTTGVGDAPVTWEPRPLPVTVTPAGDGVTRVVVIIIANNTDDLSTEVDRDRTEHTVENTIGVPDEQTFVLTDADEDVILGQIQVEAAVLDDDDQLFVFNASHGEVDTNGPFLKTGVPGQQITPEEMASSWAGTEAEVTFVTDSCFSNPFNEKLTEEDDEVVALGSADGPAIDKFRGGAMSNEINRVLGEDPDADLSQIVATQEQKIRDIFERYGLPDSAADEYLETGVLTPDQQLEYPTDAVIDLGENTVFRRFGPDRPVRFNQERTGGGTQSEQGDETTEEPPPIDEDLPGEPRPPTTRGSDDSDQTEVLTSFDPNDKAASDDFARPGETIDFLIRFENDAEAAQVPAQEVVVTDVLSPDLDLDTVELSEIRFGDQIIVVPPGRDSFVRRVSAFIDGRTEYIDIEVTLDPTTRTLTWRLTSVDPLTGTFPDDPFAGFLPPNDDTGVGEGSLSFRVATHPDTPTGTVVENTASIVFDTNEAIITNTTPTTVDEDTPTITADAATPTAASVEVGATVGEVPVVVEWSGTDPTSAVTHFDVWVSVDGGPWQMWQRRTTATSDTWNGTLDQQLAFLAKGVDSAGNPDADETSAELVITVTDPGDGGDGGDGDGGGDQPGDPADPDGDTGTDDPATTPPNDGDAGAGDPADPFGGAEGAAPGGSTDGDDGNVAPGGVLSFTGASSDDQIRLGIAILLLGALLATLATLRRRVTDGRGRRLFQ